MRNVTIFNHRETPMNNVALHQEVWPELYDPDFPDKYAIEKLDTSTPSPLPFRFNDGGRAKAGFSGSARDCVARSIAIASGLSYIEVYSALAQGNATQRASKRTPRRTRTASQGIFTQRKWFKDYMTSLGFVWEPTQRVGSVNKARLCKGALPNGKLVVSVSRHYTAVINGVIHDTFDCSRNGKRCVYGYWVKRT